VAPAEQAKESGILLPTVTQTICINSWRKCRQKCRTGRVRVATRCAVDDVPGTQVHADEARRKVIIDGEMAMV